MGKKLCVEDKNRLKKGQWTVEEDQKLIDYIQKHGHGKWKTVSKDAGIYANYLCFCYAACAFVLPFFKFPLCIRWSAIAARLPGRTDNEIKNYWNTHIRKRLLRMGIDPVTHAPRLCPLEIYSILNSTLYNLPPVHTRNVLGIESTLNLEEFQPFQVNQIHGSVQEVQACVATTSSAPLLDDTLIMQANVGQFYPRAASYGCRSSLPNLYRNDDDQSSCIGLGFVEFRAAEYYYNNYNKSLLELQSENQMFQYSNEGTPRYSFGSVLSTPSSGSSSTAFNLSATTSYVNGSNEEERESYCRNMLFNVPYNLDVDGIIKGNMNSG
ncbi:unnamed protein product [Ilex paraguariensis]|uniref:Uncharacterized protein n=1 Tax=Ilex paraguariensis TaxID=185542 RepID=A0ABC8RHZ8_9AQUA